MVNNPKPGLDMPPFPPLVWDECYWTGRAVLASWQGFQRRLGPYASKNSTKQSDGTVRLTVESPQGVAERPPSAEQVAAYRYLLEQQDEIRDGLITALFEEYPTIRKRLLEQRFVEEPEIPIFQRPDDLKGHIGLGALHVLRVTKDGAAYIGFEFGCSWDEEHGIGLMVHQGRIVDIPAMGIGKVFGADLASEDWVAEEDARAAGSKDETFEQIMRRAGRTNR